MSNMVVVTYFPHSQPSVLVAVCNPAKENVDTLKAFARQFLFTKNGYWPTGTPTVSLVGHSLNHFNVTFE